MSLGRDALLAIVRRVAPDFLPLFEGDGIASFMRRLVTRGFRALFGGVMGRIRGALRLGSAFGVKFRLVAGWFAKIARQLVRNDCSGILTAASRVGAFFSNTFGPVVNRVRSIASSVADFFRSMWNAVGAPVMRFLRLIGGAVWESLRGFLSDVGAIIRRVKNALGAAWSRVKAWFGIEAEEGTSEGGGLWNWIRDKASALWDGIQERLQPIMGPLRVVGGILLAISPAGPILAVIHAWPHLRQAFAWIQRTWRDLNLVVRARRFVANTVLPTLMGAARRVGQALIRGADWLLGLLGRVSQGVARAAESLSGGILAPLGHIVRFAQSQFQRLVDWARGGLRYVATHARSMLQRLLEFLRPILQALRRIIALAVNPFGIPGFLMGTLWRFIPNCLKGPIINFIINLLRRFLRALPPLPQLGLLWPFLKAGMLGFLDRMRRFATARKVALSNKIARIISGASVGFVFGYLKGLALGVWEAVIGPFQAIADLFRLPAMIRQFVQALGENFDELMTRVRQFLSSVQERAVGTYERLVEAAQDLIRNPRKILDLIRAGIQAAMSAVRSLGATLAERIVAIFEEPEAQIGERLGNVTGNLLVEALLAYFTAGSATALSAIRRVVSLLGRAVRNVVRVVRSILRHIPRFLRFLRRLGRRFRGAGSRAGGILERIRAFFQRIADWLRRVLRRRRRRPGRHRDRERRRRDRDRDRPRDRDRRRRHRDRRRRDRDRDRARDRRAWVRFLASVRSALARFRDEGIEGQRLRRLFGRLLHRHRIARRPFGRAVRKDEPYWTLRARKRRGVRNRQVGRVLLGRRSRWREGRRAVRRLVRRLKRRRRLTISRIRTGLREIRRRYAYERLRAEYKSEEVEFEIRGSMSPGNKVTKVDPPPPPQNRFRVTGPNRAEVDPLVKKSSYSAPSVSPPLWDEVGPIRSRSGRSSLYIRGHLISGWLSGPGSNPGNMTPITRRSNSRMLSKMERTAKSRVKDGPDKDHVYSYRVRGIGRATMPPPPRYIRKNDTWVHRQVPEEARLVRGIAMTLTRKVYDKDRGVWKDSRSPGDKKVAGVKNVPDPQYSTGYPPGYVPPGKTGPG